MSPRKEIYTPIFLNEFASEVQFLQPNFKSNQFVEAILKDPFDQLSLRQRMKKIATLLGDYLTGEYEEKLALILKLHETNQGFNYFFLPDFVAIHGLKEENLELSLDYLKKLTIFSSSEFAIRKFLLFNQETTLDFLITCSFDENEHVRRLASEGCRPRLPWGCQLMTFKNNPELSLPILSQLKNDPSLYVRKSVANHLNDLSKDHPDFVISLCKEWQNKSKETDWIIKRACRSLLKQAYPPALNLFSYHQPGEYFNIKKALIKIENPVIQLGKETNFTYLIQTTIDSKTPIRLEYGINYIKANGQAALKKFHLFDGKISKSELSGSKKISFKPLSTRTYYPGNHQLLLFCNGRVVAETSFLVNL